MELFDNYEQVRLSRNYLNSQAHKHNKAWATHDMIILGFLVALKISICGIRFENYF